MRAASSRIWFATSTNQPTIQPITCPDNQPAEDTHHTDHSTQDLSASEYNPTRNPQGMPSEFSNDLPAPPMSAMHPPVGNGRRSFLVDGYAQLITDRVQAGWSAYLVTFMFSQLPGPRAAVMARIKDEVQRVYSTLLTRVHRKPRTAPADELPVLIGSLDLPVYKRDRASAPEVLRNGGLHVHAVVLIPPNSRLRGSLVDHFEDNQGLYAGNGIQRVHVVPADRDYDRLTDYVLKTVLNGRLVYDEAMIVLPRSRAELQHRYPNPHYPGGMLDNHSRRGGATRQLP
jgi:hypothetical protein